MKVFVECLAGSRIKNRYDEHGFVLRDSSELLDVYPYYYGFIIGTGTATEDCIDCYIASNGTLEAGAILDCEPVGMIELREDSEIDHKVLMIDGKSEAVELPAMAERIKVFITNIFKKFPEVAVSFGETVDASAALKFIEARKTEGLAALKPQTVVRMRVLRKNGYCPVFSVGHEIVIKKHCFDTSINTLEKYCYATLADIYPLYYRMRREAVGTKERFKCRDNGIIEIELERLPDEIYDYENH